MGFGFHLRRLCNARAHAPTTYDHCLAIEATAGKLTTWVGDDRPDDCWRCPPLLGHRGAVVAGRILRDHFMNGGSISGQATHPREQSNIQSLSPGALFLR